MPQAQTSIFFGIFGYAKCRWRELLRRRRGIVLMAESELRRVGGMEEVGRRMPIHREWHEGFNKPILVFLTVCTKDKNHFWPTMRCTRCLKSRGVKPIRGSLAGMFSCRIICIFFALLRHRNRPRFSNGYRIGNPTPRGIGLGRMRLQSGNTIFGIPN